jgi:DNA-binding XRE family transcriptional regulator/predicted GIY-YIG superfamily endonuclease
MAGVNAQKQYMIYRVYDDKGGLLYVGMSKSAMARVKDHFATSPWGKTACTITIEVVADREAALLAERSAIKAEKPMHNIVHAPPLPKQRPGPGVIKAFIDATGKSREGLAKEAGVSRQTLHKVENGLTTPRIEVASRLARAIGCPVEVIRPDIIGLLQ